MLKETTEEAYGLEEHFVFISLLAAKIRVIIIGGGRAASIKAKTYNSKGCQVTVLAKAFCDEVKLLKAKHVRLIEAEYTRSHIIDQHLIVIAIDNEEVNRIIRADCEQMSKLYLTCSDYREGLFVTPVMRETEATVVALHTKGGSPKTSVFIGDKLQKWLKKYDVFIKFACTLRKQLQHRKDKEVILNFVNSEEFLCLFEQGKHHEFCERHDIK
jgi:precorrin-2 dehydrogenase/sirohydrochlorin ferrochelatase